MKQVTTPTPPASSAKPTPPQTTPNRSSAWQKAAASVFIVIALVTTWALTNKPPHQNTQAADVTVTVNVNTNNVDPSVMKGIAKLFEGEVVDIALVFGDDENATHDTNSTTGTYAEGATKPLMRGTTLEQDLHRFYLEQTVQLSQEDQEEIKNAIDNMKDIPSDITDVVIFELVKKIEGIQQIACASDFTVCEAVQNNTTTRLKGAWRIVKRLIFDEIDDFTFPSDWLIVQKRTAKHQGIKTSQNDSSTTWWNETVDSGERRRRLGVFCSKYSGSCKSEFVEQCKKEHLLVANDLRLAAIDLERTSAQLQRLGLAKCPGIDSYDQKPYDKEYQECRGAGGGNGGLEDMLQHMLYTGLLYRRVHTDTWGRGKHKARDIALRLMNKREECQLDKRDWHAVMDMVNNEQGANMARDLTGLKCTFRIWFWCVVRKEVPPSPIRLGKQIAKVSTQQARAVPYSSPSPSTWDGQRGKPMFLSGNGITECFDGCSGHGICEDHRCKCDNHYFGTSCGHHVPPPRPRRRRRCFPGDAKVMTRQGQKLMKDIRVGDHVLTDMGTFSPVYLQGHADEEAISQFVCLKTATQHEICLSPLHYIRANGVHMHAQEVKVGDKLTVIDGSRKNISAVVSISYQMLKGLFNPYTVSGNIVVNWVISSVHSEWWLESKMEPAKIPDIYQTMLMPVRLLYSAAPTWLERFDLAIRNETAKRSLDEAGTSEIIAAALRSAIP